MQGKQMRSRRVSAILCSVLAGALAISLSADRAHAAAIHGAISFNGNVTAYLNASGTGTEAMDFTLAHSLVFGTTNVSANPTGTFAGITTSTLVDLFSPLEINPPQLPVPTTSPLWQVTFGGVTYKFTLNTLTEPLDTSSALELSGSGTISDSISPSDSSPASWVATFTTSGCTYSWNSSAKAVAVPEPTSIAILSLAGLCLLSRRRSLAA